MVPSSKGTRLPTLSSVWSTTSPDHLFSPRLDAIYVDIVEWLATRQFQGFTTQSGTMKLFGPRPEQSSTEQARRFVSELHQLWQDWR